MPPPDWSGLRYLIVGAANTLFGLFVIYGCKWLFGLGDVAANATGYGFGIALSFLLNKRWTFAYDGAALPALVRFVIVVAIAYLANLMTVVLLIAMGVNGYLAQALGIIPYTLIGYAGSRLFAFATSYGNH